MTRSTGFKYQFILLFLLILSISVNAAKQTSTAWQNQMSWLKKEYQSFYAPQDLWQLGLAVGGAAILANTKMDRQIDSYYQNHLRGVSSNRFRRAFKPFGNTGVVIAGHAGILSLGYLLRDKPIGHSLLTFGTRSLHGLAIGIPLVIVGQRLTGGGRPVRNEPSKWHPFKHGNGVSGHAFLGAMPFLTLSTMTDRPFLKGLLVVGSMMPGLSRVNDRSHYTSQVLLGWVISYLSVRAVDKTQGDQDGWHLQPTLTQQGGVGVGIRTTLT